MSTEDINLPARHKIGDLVTITARVAGVQFAADKVRYAFDIGPDLSVVDSDHVIPAVDASMGDLDARYNHADDIVTIAGIKYSGNVFREFGGVSGSLEIGQKFILAKRQDGVLTIMKDEA
jgi:hypothetical protein